MMTVTAGAAQASPTTDLTGYRARGLLTEGLGATTTTTLSALEVGFGLAYVHQGDVARLAYQDASGQTRHLPV
ncbi:MAG: hypothetical protein KC635_21620, partial [Myxococcales bacterium]|nr:hypothetical protein [Myxococcales bacterium]